MRTWVIGIAVCFCGFIIWIGTQSANNPQWMTPNGTASMVHDSINDYPYSRLADKPVLFNGAYGSLSGLPSLSTGTVTSVGATSSDLDVSNTPITSSGNITVNVKNQYKTLRYNNIGLITDIAKEWYGIITPSTASGQTIDISSAGFTSISCIQVSAANNSGSATSVPLVGIKSYTTSQVTLNIVSSNNNTIANLLSPIIGLVFPSSVAGYTIHVVVKGT